MLYIVGGRKSVVQVMINVKETSSNRVVVKL